MSIKKTNQYIDIKRSIITTDNNCVDRKTMQDIISGIYICLYDGQSRYRPDDLNMTTPNKSYKIIIDNPKEQGLIVNNLLIIKECDIVYIYDCGMYLGGYIIDIIKCYQTECGWDNLQLELHKIC